MGIDWSPKSAIVRLTLSYWAVFALVVVALALGAYVFEERVNRDLVAPLLNSPQTRALGEAALGRAMERVVWILISIAVPLLALVAIAAALVARHSIAPLEAAAERERDFAADIAHELRTPLATIASVAQQRAIDARDAERTAFETIAAAALDASRLVGDLALLARAGGPEKLERETIDVSDTVTRVTREYAVRKGAPRIDLASASVFAEADERRMAQVVRNLLDNAVRHARSTIRVAVHPDGDFAAIIVDDDGPGVPGEIRSRVFDRLVRAGDGAGSGLGLAICRWVARAHGGDVSLESSARFVVRIPRLQHDGIDS
ncbi:MAG TPA: HAMP domain-containing sensor histidine kinase [Candidatus Baltobacteraceae bacterium]|nr:HAMP domain-containing sensor histidine kinase [Candidatus Baltobacteraceae bacterium]